MGTVIGMIIILAVANEAANGVNFSLVPHCNPCEYQSPLQINFALTTFYKVPMVSW